MQPLDDKDRQWTDRQLRKVHVPSELISRLKAIGEDYRDVLNFAIRSVPVPSGLLTRAKAIPGDASQNKVIQDVALPDGLQDRLKGIPTDEAMGSGQCRSASQRPTPSSGKWAVSSDGHQPDVTHTAFWRRWSSARWATAAMLMVVVGAAYFTTVSGLFVSRDRPVANHTTDPVDLGTDALVVTPLEVPAASGDTNLWQSSTFREKLLAWMNAIRPPKVNWTWPEGVTTPDARTQDTLVLTMPFRHRPDRSMEQAPRPKLRGIAPPPTREYDLLSLARDGVHPFVSPGSNKLLRSASVPLVTTTDSFDGALRDLTAGRWPKSASIRFEDFLAAVDYGFEPPTTTPLQLHVGGGPSPWAKERYLLHIAVKAREIVSQPYASARKNETTGTLLVVVVDPSMRSPGTDCFDLVRTGLAKLANAVDTDDRVIVIAAGNGSATLLADVGQNDCELLRTAANRIVPQPLADIPAALKDAAELFAETVSNRAKLVLLITGSQREPVRDTRQMGQAIRAIVDHGGRFYAMRLGELSTGATRLDNLTRLGGGRAYHTFREASFGHVAVELLASQSASVAEGVHMTIVWNPSVVARYRIIGHAPSTAGGLLAGPIETDLFVGETAAAMFEIDLQPAHRGAIGTVQLKWRDPATGTPHRLEQPIHGSQISPTFVEAAPAVQLATLATSMAEILRKSPHAPGGFGVDNAFRLADSVNPILYDNRSLRDLVDMLEAMARTRE